MVPVYTDGHIDQAAAGNQRVLVERMGRCVPVGAMALAALSFVPCHCDEGVSPNAFSAMEARDVVA